jgi:hypothetical protein
MSIGSMYPRHFLAEGGKGRRGIDGQPAIDLTEAAPEGPSLSMDFPEGNGQAGQGRIDEEHAVVLAQLHQQVLLTLEHAVPSVDGNMNDLGRRMIHRTGLTEEVAEKVIFRRLLKNTQMQGPRNPEE